MEFGHDSFVHDMMRRYPSEEMKKIFSDDTKYGGWRKVWVYNAESQKDLSNGRLAIQEEVDDLKSKMDPKNIDYSIVEEIEKKKKHDVVSHSTHFGDQCPKGKRIVHLALTSKDPTDNIDIYQQKEALDLTLTREVNSLDLLNKNVLKYKSLPVIGLTHKQPAAPITLGKRFAMWGEGKVIGIKQLEYLLDNIKARGLKGAIGGQDTLMGIFNGNDKLVKMHEDYVMDKLGFKNTYTAIGQVYPREWDYSVLSGLALLAANTKKTGMDLRDLQSRGELEEPFGEEQVGSSAMPHKRNPVLIERMIGLSNYVAGNAPKAWDMATDVSFEGDVTDSSIRRLIIPESFLGIDSINVLYQTIIDGLKVYPEISQKFLETEKPFISMQTLVTHATKNGGNRGELHEEGRKLSMKASKLIKEGKPHTLLEDVKNSDLFKKYLKPSEIDELSDVKKHVGRSEKICEEFAANVAGPILEKYNKRRGNIVKTEI